MNEFLIALRDLMIKHNAEFSYTRCDDGVWASVAGEHLCLGFFQEDQLENMEKAINDLKD